MDFLLDSFLKKIVQLTTFVSDLPSQYKPTVLISILVITIITIIALKVGKKNVDMD